MSETDSDESINTEDLNEILETKKETVGGVERSSPKKEKKEVKTKKVKTEKDLGEVKEEVKEVVEEVKEKPKVKKPRTQAQIEATKRLVEANRLKKENNKKEKKVEEVKEVEKKQKGRPKKPIEEKLAKQVITKEKVIYMVANDTGGYDEINPKRLGKRELRKIELEEQAKKEEIELGKKLIRRKTGAVDKRSKNTRTEKQIENAKKLVAFNKKRKEDKLKQEQENLNKVIKETVTDTVVDVVSKPISVIKQERRERKNIITDEELKQYEFSKKKSLFS